MTQIPVADSDLAAMVQRAFGTGAEIVECADLPGGTDTILKVAPPAHLDRLASTVAVPVPTRGLPAGEPVHLCPARRPA